MQKKIFISYASRDRRIAESICEALEKRGHKGWMSHRDVMGGENYQGAIVRAIRNAGAMVVVFSANANNSDEIKKELALASQARVMVIPVRTEDVVPNEDFSYELATRQWIDLFDDRERGLEQLVRQADFAIPRLEPEVPPPEPVPQPKPEIAPAPPPETTLPLAAGENKRKNKLLRRIVAVAWVLAFAVWKFWPAPQAAQNPQPEPASADNGPAPSNPAPQVAANPPPVSAGNKPVPADPGLNAQVQEAVDSARAAEVQANQEASKARLAQARVRQSQEQARLAAQQGEAGAEGYGILTRTTADGGSWRWAGQVSNNDTNGFGIGSFTAGPNQGQRYEGENRNSKKDGAGTNFFANGERYDGEFAGDHYNGVGICLYANSDRYEGQFQDDKRNGLGVYSGGSTRAYREKVGQWSADAQTGYGVIYWKDGTVWIGNWKTDKLDGYGAKYDAQGRIAEQGLYDSGTLKTALTAN